MSSVLQQKTCKAGHVQDVVELSFGSTTIILYYQTAFQVAAGILGAAKLAARFEGVPPAKWSEMVNCAQQDDLEPQARNFRRGVKQTNIKEWSVAFERNLVVFHFDDATIKMHYSSAFEFYVWTRTAAKNAKRWSGDRGRQLTTRAHLVDAEENDKFLYVH